MREILFKAKRTDNREWVEGFYVRLPERELSCVNHYNLSHFIVTNKLSNGIKVLGLGCSPEYTVKEYDVDPETICRNTEMNDKNKKDIWEHDIVRAWSEGNCAVGEVRKRIDGLWIIFPAWQDKEFWGLCPNEKGETTVEVLGNIFDNPALLKGGDDT